MKRADGKIFCFIYNYSQYCWQNSFFLRQKQEMVLCWVYSTQFVWKPLFVVNCLRANLQKCKHMLPFCFLQMSNASIYVYKPIPYTLYDKNRSINTIVITINKMRKSKEQRKNRNKICCNMCFVGWQLPERMLLWWILLLEHVFDSIFFRWIFFCFATIESYLF